MPARPDHSSAPTEPSLRLPRPGDIGWVVHRHAALYHEEYGFDWTFEALVARIAADVIDTFDPARDCIRIACVGDRIAGSAFVVRQSDEVAKLRLVYLEPWARGTGLGRRLVEDCMGFARGAGYSRMTLWTQDFLLPARRLYAGLGFVLVSSNSVIDFGRPMVNEVWEREL